MAYSNWGAKVWCDGKACHQNCDVTPKMVLSEEVYTHYLAHYLMGREDNKLTDMYHAVVGDKNSGILIALYKYVSYGIWRLPEMVHTTVQPEVEVGGIVVRFDEEDNQIECSFTDPKGREWKGISGYMMGEGFEEWD